MAENVVFVDTGLDAEKATKVVLALPPKARAPAPVIPSMAPASCRWPTVTIPVASAKDFCSSTVAKDMLVELAPKPRTAVDTGAA